MKSEHSIATKWKMHIIALPVIILSQCMACFLLRALLKEFARQDISCSIMLLIVVLVCIAIDLYYLFNRVILLQRLMHRTPVKCKLEDIFLISHRDTDNRMRYSPFPIVRSLKDHKLYLAYDNYSLLGFKEKFNYSDRKKITCTLYKGNGIPVRFGDIVDMYMLKTLNIPVSIDSSKNIVRLKHRKLYFHHVNNQINIDVFRDIVFFKGAIDLDVSVL